jgi:hypothetical protein
MIAPAFLSIQPIYYSLKISDYLLPLYPILSTNLVFLSSLSSAFFFGTLEKLKKKSPILG